MKPAGLVPPASAGLRARSRRESRFDTPGPNPTSTSNTQGTCRPLDGVGLFLVARFVEGPLGVAGSEHSGAGEPALAYERFAGGARRPLTGKWRRRGPERTVLRAPVRAHLRTFLEEARARPDGGPRRPRFGEAGFGRLLACGILGHCF